MPRNLRRLALALVGCACLPTQDCDGGDSAEPASCEGLPWMDVTGDVATDSAWAIAVDDAGDVYAASFEGEAWTPDVVVRRRRPDGEVVWEATWGSTYTAQAFVVVVHDGIVYVGGLVYPELDFIDTDALLLRFDVETGAAIGGAWTWTSDGWDELDGIGVDEGEIYLSGGPRGPEGDTDMRVIRLSADLETVWDVTAGAAGALDAGNGHLVLGDEHVYVAGSWNNTGYLFDQAQGVLAAFDRADGALAWTSLVGDGTDYREVFGLTSDGANFYGVGWRKESNTDTQLMAWSWDAGGGLRWTAEWGGEGIEKARAIEYDPLSDSVLIAGSTTSGESEDIALLRLSASDGALLEEQVWGGAGNEVAKNMALFGERLYVVGPTTSWGAGDTDALTLGVCHSPWVLPD